MQASSPNFSVEQVELIRRLRNSGITCEQLIDAFKALERIDATFGNTFNSPVNSRHQQKHILTNSNHYRRNESHHSTFSATSSSTSSCESFATTDMPVTNTSSIPEAHLSITDTQRTSATQSSPGVSRPGFGHVAKEESPDSLSDSSAGTIGHSLMNHIDKLNNLCRLCARRCINHEHFRKLDKPRCVKDFQKDILSFLHVNVENDISEFHSPSVCAKCISTITNIKMFAQEKNRKEMVNSEKDTAKVWTPFSNSVREEDCEMCCHYNSFSARDLQGERILTGAFDDFSKQAPECPVPDSSESIITFAQENAYTNTIKRETYILENDIDMDYTTQNQSCVTEPVAPKRIFLQAVSTDCPQTISRKLDSSDAETTLSPQQARIRNKVYRAKYMANLRANPAAYRAFKLEAARKAREKRQFRKQNMSEEELQRLREQSKARQKAYRERKKTAPEDYSALI